MKRQWILYIIITVVSLGVTLQGNAASQTDKAAKKASDLAADYQTLAGSVSSLGMNAGDVIIDARLPLDGIAEARLRAILDDLPHKANTAIVTDFFHDTRWLHITCTSGADNIYADALAVLSALGPNASDAVRLSVNASWHTGTIYSSVEKKELIRSIFASIEARTIASMADEGITSASGFSPRLSGRAYAGSDALNITASLRTHPGREGGALWLGTPVLTVEY